MYKLLRMYVPQLGELLCELVADPVDRLDVLCAYGAAYLAHVHVDRADADLGILPDGLE